MALEHNLVLRIPKDLRQTFKLECTKREVTMAYLIKDYIKKQLKFWAEQEHREKMGE